MSKIDFALKYTYIPGNKKILRILNFEFYSIMHIFIHGFRNINCNSTIRT